MEEHWSKFAKLWEHNLPPLRPSAQDIAFIEKEISSFRQDKQRLRTLILGVTPELYGLNWPEGTDWKAIDHTLNMIKAIWPGKNSDAICAEWTALPLAKSSRDIVLCDGGLHLMQFPNEQHAFVESMSGVLAPGGLCIFRLFVPPNQQERPEDVLQDLMKAKIPNLSILKLRLGMSLQQDAASGVQLADVWQTIHQVAPDFNLLAGMIGWPVEHLTAINTYRNSSNRYHFSELQDVIDMFCNKPGGFRLNKVSLPDYAMGKQCPTIVLSRI